MPPEVRMQPLDPVVPSSLSSRQFCLAMEHAAIGTALVSLDGQCLYGNAALRRLFGYDQDELVRLSIADLTHPDDLAADLGQLADMTAGKIPSYRMEKRYVRKDRSVVWAELSVALVRRDDGAPDYLIAQAQDITGRRAVEAERARLVERLTVATEVARVGIWDWELQSGRLDWNAKMRELYEVPPERSVSFDDFQVRVHPEDWPLVSAAIESSRCGAPYDVEFRVVRTSGEVRRVKAQAVVLADHDGAPERMIGANLDITELRRLAEQAEAASEAKSQFLATMSHEIRTPLNGVMGVAGALARTELAPDQREMVSLIETSAGTLETLLSDILDLARIEAGKMELRPEPFDLAASVGACTALFDAAAQAKGLDLEVAIAPAALGAYVGDAARIRQVLANLLGNAVKFTTVGKVSLGVDARRGETGSELRFEVRDTGIGFDAETKARLFSRFEQADGSITRRFGGSGLGLAISRSLAEAMGGRLEADAEPGEGAVFTLVLELPRCASAPDLWVESADPEPESDPLVGLRVLLAEDHPTNRRVVELILGAAGVAVTCVENGVEAVDAFRRSVFDLILMDMQMPLLDGLSAIREIRRIEAAAGAAPLPIHVLTANAMPEHVAASRAAGADGHLSKPILAEALVALVAEVAQRRLEPPAPRRAARAERS
jgi:PAS domain S-box-containing protein